jgi:DNA gyrase subunit A
MLISDRGTLVRIRGDDVSQQGHNTQGVRLINLAADENLVGIARVQEPDEGFVVNGADDDSTETGTSDTNDSGADDEGQQPPAEDPTE